MLRRVDAKGPAGRKTLAKLSAARRSVDFSALRDAMPIVEEVLAGGLPALRRYVREFDGVDFAERDILVEPEAPAGDVDPAFRKAFKLAEKRLRAYHRRQRPRPLAGMDRDGFSYTESFVPLPSVGVYVPGGRAFYPSSLLMGVVPAQEAGVPRIVLATPPRAFSGSPELRWAVAELGIREVLLAGGAHGIAGLVNPAGCVKIVGPGNRWVAAAKHLLSSLVSVDLPAGPSEVLILASADAPAERVAADLLAQAEHDPDAICLLFTDSAPLARRVGEQLQRQLATLTTRQTARESLRRHGMSVVFPSLAEAARQGVGVAAEHVQVMGKRAEPFAETLAATAGAVFVGSSTPTAFGDYLAGPNHVLPTAGAGRAYSGLSLRDFLRCARTARLTPGLAQALSAPAATLARFEGLEGHARSLELRGAVRGPRGGAAPGRGERGPGRGTNAGTSRATGSGEGGETPRSPVSPEKRISLEGHARSLELRGRAGR